MEGMEITGFFAQGLELCFLLSTPGFSGICNIQMDDWQDCRGALRE